MRLNVCPAAEPESPWSSEAETSTLREKACIHLHPAFLASVVAGHKDNAKDAN